MNGTARDTYERFVALYKSDAAIPPMLERLCQYVAWVETGSCMIRDQAAEIIPMQLNSIQQTILGHMMLQAAQGHPVRIIVLKARKGGTSTLVQTLSYFLCQNYPNQMSMTLAHVPKATLEIFEIGKVVAKYGYGKVELMREAFRFPGTGSRASCHTSGGEGVGAGGTPSILHLSEVALWKRNKEETEYTATIAVPDEPNTIIVQESTARGRDMFYEKWEAADDPEHAYAQVFIPWFMDDRLRSPCPDDIQMDADETELYRLARKGYGIELDARAMMWRRLKIKEIGEVHFRQEFPATPEECIQGQRGLILPGLRSCIIDTLPFTYALLDYEHRTGGMDYGYHDPTVLITSCYVDQVLYVIDVYWAVECLPADHVDYIREGHKYYCDPSAVEGRTKMLAEIQRRAIAARMVPAPRAKTDRAVTYVDAEWEMLLGMVRGGRLKILRDCAERLIIEADSLSWNPKTGRPEMSRGKAWAHYDALEALRYNVMGVEKRVATEAGALVDRHRMNRRREFRL